MHKQRQIQVSLKKGKPKKSEPTCLRLLKPAIIASCAALSCFISGNINIISKVRGLIVINRARHASVRCLIFHLFQWIISRLLWFCLSFHQFAFCFDHFVTQLPFL